jgi:hypothetical protein
MFLFGFAILSALLLAGHAEITWIGPVFIGDHWAIAASAAMAIAVQTAVMGLMALLYSYREGLRRPGPRARAFFRRSRLEYWLLAGGGCIAAGALWAGAIAADWIATGFAALDATRALTAAFTLVIIGCQLFFAGFLMSILCGNKARHAAAI